MQSHNESIIIDHFKDAELSIRACHVCARANIKTIEEMHFFLLKNGSFLSIKNCGAKSNSELLSFYRKYYIAEAIESTENSEEGIQNPLKFEEVILAEFNKLSTRARNVILRIQNNNIDWKDFIKDIVRDKEFEIYESRNVGVKTSKEIVSFINSAKKHYYNFTNDNPSPEDLACANIKHYSGVNEIDKLFIVGYINNTFPLLKFAKKYFREICELDEVEVDALDSLFGYSDISLETIADKFNLSKERVRQKRIKSLDKAKLALSSLSSLLYKTTYSNRASNLNIINISTDFDERTTNEIESVGLLFSNFVLNSLLIEIFYSLSKLTKIQKPNSSYDVDKYNLHKNINGNYLIRYSIISEKEIIRFVDKVLFLICSRHDTDSVYNLDSLTEYNFTNSQSYIYETILLHEFGIECTDGKFVIKRNSPIQLHEYALNALREIGKPSHISEIMNHIQMYKRDFDHSVESLKSSMGRNKSLFIFFGRTSTFGLKEWETTSKHIKGGTIRDIVEEFLHEQGTPCHIDVITDFVNRFRKTNRTSILYNLKFTEGDRFIFLKNNMVGLASKAYSQSL